VAQAIRAEESRHCEQRAMARKLQG